LWSALYARGPIESFWEPAGGGGVVYLRDLCSRNVVLHSTSSSELLEAEMADHKDAPVVAERPLADNAAGFAWAFSLEGRDEFVADAVTPDLDGVYRGRDPWVRPLR
jgi:hypothetical protein